MTFGLTANGMRAKRQEDVESELRAAVATAPSLGANIYTDPRSPLGQILVIVAGALAALWALAEQVLLNARIRSATGVALERLGQNLALSKNPATYSTVTLTLAGTPATVVPAGSRVSLDDTEAVFVTDADATIGGGGTIDVAATAEEAGPIQALSGSSWDIDTPVSGWAGASNALDATPGVNLETDGAYRARLLSAVGRGTQSNDAIRSAVLAVSGVTEAIVIENDTATTDSAGRPAKSYEVVARGGADADVAAAILQTKPTGIETTTTVSGPNQVTEIVVDTNGENRTIYFSRVDLVDVWVEVDYRPQPGVFPTNGVTLMQNAILDFGASLLIGDDVYPASLEQAVTCALPSRALQLFDLRVGLSASPLTAIVIPTSRTQLPAFDTSRILIAQV